ncbi:hypothetical protein GLIP_1442 [Aliiglaciecola lipolytica E3]|uniref:Uncharacterized protein n=1 Tax=Aliiglaciecola lipolytica E3 TaxID=1127673 RepID=K6Y778_9ALTE|nr:hypothetical protein GLIP_1442 [Aliiglaciecola lipolytica E3]
MTKALLICKVEFAPNNALPDFQSKNITPSQGCGLIILLKNVLRLFD